MVFRWIMMMMFVVGNVMMMVVIFNERVGIVHFGSVEQLIVKSSFVVSVVVLVVESEQRLL